MEPGAGLDSPRLQLPKIDKHSPLPLIPGNDIVFIGFNSSLTTKGSRKPATAFGAKNADPAGVNNSAVTMKNQFMKRKFKPTPTTQNEIRECKARLSRGELLQSVTAGNKKIDFGVVAVGSENVRLFDVSNVSHNCNSHNFFNMTKGLRHHIHVQLVSDHPELIGITPTYLSC